MRLLNINAPNPAYQMTGYKPTTDYWAKMLDIVNMAVLTKNSSDLEANINKYIRPETPEQWAEKSMVINHVLWLVYELKFGDNELHQELDRLYYKQHNHALDTLKGEALSTYLRITD